MDIEEGSLWKFEAVRSASCFCCRVVPPAGAWEEGGGDAVESLEKREDRVGRLEVVGEGLVVDWED